MSELRDLEQLIAVADEGQFAKASRVLGVGQSALTKAVQRLEARLGTKLVNRSRAGLSLTESGRVVVERSRGLVQRYADLVREVELIEGVRSGR